MLEISPTFSLPGEAVTETFAMLAKRGMGKSNAAVVMAEEMTKQEVADATGYSITSSGLGNALGKLRSLELVDGWRVSEDLIA